MCGITGFVGRGNRTTLEGMTEILRHRGPDDGDVWIEEDAAIDAVIGLGHRRLSIIDLTDAGRQPMSTADGRYWITFNGEIYNFAGLRKELEAAGCRFRSNCDTEVLLYGYAVWGEALLEKLNGIFAFAIWDRRDKTLFVARDRLGIKPFYYTWCDGTFLFASEIKSLLQYPGVRRRISPTALHQYLSFLWVPDPATLLEGVLKLEAGYCARWSERRLTMRRWWDCADQAARPEAGSLSMHSAAVRGQLEKSVRTQLVADVPVGAFLSGGVDSSAVVALMAGQTGMPSTYTVGFTAEDLSYEIVQDDIGYARMMRDRYRLDYHEIILKPDVIDVLPNVVWHMDEPVSDPAAISAYLICRAARQTLKVMLNGQGGDEVFAGYPRHVAMRYARFYNWLPGIVRQAIRRMLSPLHAATTGRRSTWVRNFKKFTRGADLPFHERYLSYLTHFHAAEKVALYQPELRRQLENEDAYATHRGHLSRVAGADPVAQMCYLDLKTFLPSLNLTYTDKMSMAHGVEVRVPFLDHELVEMALRIPDPLKLRRATPKFVLKKALEGMLPDEIIWRQKAGFTAPIRSWLQQDLAPLVDQWLSPRAIQDRGLFDPAVVRQLVAEYRSGREDNAWKIWQLITLELWTRTFIDSDGRAPVAIDAAQALASRPRAARSEGEERTKSAEAPTPAAPQAGRPLAMRRVRTAAAALASRATLASIYAGTLAAHAVLGPVGRMRRRGGVHASAKPATGHTVLVLATFYTRNWCLAHMQPLARACNVARVLAVVDGPTQPIDRVQYCAAPRWLSRLTGRAASKVLWALRLAVRERPDLVVGYHLVPSAIGALLVARATGARSAYQMTGGPVELLGGGSASENYVMKALHTPSRLVEWLACEVARRFDLIVVRGSSARRFMRERRLGRHVEIVPGSIDVERFSTNGDARPFDIVMVSRLVPIKQPEQLLLILDRLRERGARFQALVLGDGPLLEPLKARAAAMGMEGQVEFRGHVENVEASLRQSKIFLLTSKSEGLSIAMAEAMAAGAVPVVADVGELGELVRNEETGWRIAPADIHGYADRIAQLLADPAALRRCSVAARAAAVAHNSLDSVSGRWATTIAGVCDGAVGSAHAPRIGERRTARPRSLTRLQMWEAVPWTAKRAIAPLVRHAPKAWVLGRRFRRASEFIAQAERWRLEQSQAYQLRQLRRICRVAGESSAYYRETFRRCGFDPRGMRSCAELAALPTMDRRTVGAHWRGMCTRSPSGRGIDEVSTGGTSGEPLKFYTDANRSAVEYAYLVAGWRRAGFTLDLPQAVLRGLVVPPDPGGLRHQYDPLLQRHYYSNFHMTDENMRRYLEHIGTIGPCYLLVYPSSIVALARYIERSGAKPPGNIRGVLAGSEIVYPEDRSRVQRVFGVRCFSWYGHSEKLVLAAECEHSTDYHVWPTYGYFELLDAQDRPVTTPGQRGEIVGTGFINTVMPFVRYRTGDFATFVGSRCAACGRATPLITDIRGHRTQEMLVAADGALISWTAVNMHDNTFDCVRQFQFTQSAPGRATLRIVAGGGFGSQNVERIQRNLSRKLAGRLTFDIALVDSIALTRSGKSTFVDQKIDLDRLACDAGVPA